jgi:4a-hydroxytetrahydrobiopterin dehydratase
VSLDLFLLITTGERAPLIEWQQCAPADYDRAIETSPSRRESAMAKLSDAQVTENLKALPGWERQGDSIRKMYRFKEFMDAIGFVNRVAEKAEAADHHPDITINYTRVTMSCSTHSEGGITEKDFRLAREIERAAGGS